MDDKSVLSSYLKNRVENNVSCGIWHLKLGSDLKRSFMVWTTLVSKCFKFKMKEAQSVSDKAVANPFQHSPFCH